MTCQQAMPLRETLTGGQTVKATEGLAVEHRLSYQPYA